MKYVCCEKMEDVDTSLLRAILVISPSLFMIRTSSVDDVFKDFTLDVVVLIVVPTTESEKSFGVREPVFDLVIIVLPTSEMQKHLSDKVLSFWS